MDCPVNGRVESDFHSSRHGEFKGFLYAVTPNANGQCHLLSLLDAELSM